MWEIAASVCSIGFYKLEMQKPTKAPVFTFTIFTAYLPMVGVWM